MDYEKRRHKFLEMIDEMVELGIRQDAIARQIGVTPVTVWCWINQRRPVGKITLEAKYRKLLKMWQKIGEAFSPIDTA